MEMHKCRLCFKKFMSGRALGGHMSRSHFTKLPLPQKTFQENESTSTDIEERGVAYVLRENPKKSFKVIDPEFFDDGSVVVQDKVSESEAEAEQKSTRKRSNKGKRMMEEDVASDEDVALFLLMLSRGETELKLGGKHRCEICDKVFKSSQALGGHRVSHNYKNLGVKKMLKRNNGKKKTGEENKNYECPHCGKVFGSGQALGGHKRSHFLGNPTTSKATTITTGSCSSNVGESLVGFSKSEKFQDGLIDLNLPAPMDDDDDDYEEASAVYDAY